MTIQFGHIDINCKARLGIGMSWHPAEEIG
jgi:hypothetical protein